MAKKTLLVIGNKKDWDSFEKFLKEIQSHPLKTMNVQWANYDAIKPEIKLLPNIDTKMIIVFLFFPFDYWDCNIERKGYSGIYGNENFYSIFKSFWEGKIYKQIGEFYKDKDIRYINSPIHIHVDRDKILTSETLKNAGIPVPPMVYSRDFEKILELVNEQGKKLYIKPRYGSMGKGITYLEKGRWKTNFRFKRGKIVSDISDHGWTFVDITDNHDFLKELLSHKKDIIIEEAIDSYITEKLGMKFDLRLYVFRDRVLYTYPRANKSDAVTTNISQGGQGMQQDFLENIPPRLLKKARKMAVETVKTMHLGFSGVDIILDKNLKDAYVIELNAFPGFPGVKTGVKFNLSEKILDEIDRTKWS